MAVEMAIMSLAREQLYPPDHPATLLLELAEQSLASTWVTVVKQHMSSPSLRLPIPSIWKCGQFPHDRLKASQSDPILRRSILQVYKRQIVRPLLVALDRYHATDDFAKWLPGLSCSYSHIQSWPTKLSLELLTLPVQPRMATWYCAWATIRATGCWPAHLYGHNTILHLLSRCPLCDCVDVGVGHCLFHCAASGSLLYILPGHVQRQIGAEAQKVTPRSLFALEALAGDAASIITFVGSCLDAALMGIFTSDE